MSLSPELDRGLSGRRVNFVTQLTGIGGPAGFQRRVANAMAERGIGVSYDLADRPYDAVLVIGGTRRLMGLAGARRRGARIVQRLDGINWLHRRVRTGLLHFLRAELNNLLLRVVRDRYAHQIVYQSEFARGWWEEAYGEAPVPSRVVHNGVPLDRYSPEGPESPPDDRIRLLMVEANYAGGYELGLAAGLILAAGIASEASQSVELVIAGQGDPSLLGVPDSEQRISVDWRGRVDPEQIPALYRSAHLLFSADLNPACPNSVIEAMACGLPVVAFDTGSLSELVRDDAGRLAPYGRDPWKVEPPQITSLIGAALPLVRHQARFRQAARARAEAAFGVGRMTEGYLAALFAD